MELPIGYIGDEICFEKKVVGCSCGGELDEAVKCVECGKFFPESEKMTELSMCESCLVSTASLENALLLGRETAARDQLNPFFNFMLNAEEINEILEKHVLSNKELYSERAKEFCLSDIFYWSMFVAKRKGIPWK